VLAVADVIATIQDNYADVAATLDKKTTAFVNL